MKKLTIEDYVRLGAEYNEAITELTTFEERHTSNLNCVHDLIEKLIKIIVEEDNE